MSQDLTNSSTQPQTILNNPYALQEIENADQIPGIAFEGRSDMLKEQAAAFFEVTGRTVEHHLAQSEDELSRKGREPMDVKRLELLALSLQGQDVPETKFGNISRSPRFMVLHRSRLLALATAGATGAG